MQLLDMQLKWEVCLDPADFRRCQLMDRHEAWLSAQASGVLPYLKAPGTRHQA